MTELTIFKNDLNEQKESPLFFTRPFYKEGVPQEIPFFWGMTLLKAGSMKFRWNEENPNRKKIFSVISSSVDSCGDSSLSCKTGVHSSDSCEGGFYSSDSSKKEFLSVQLDHTKIVYDVKNALDLQGKIGDGIITKNANLVPVITVADCVPIFLCDPVTKFFGVVHSGWKGTGIIENAISLAKKNYGAKEDSILVAIGPHIHNCCYIVNEERANYFNSNFSKKAAVLYTNKNAVSWNNGSGPLYSLSLLEANLSVLKKAKIPSENITVTTDCTSCNNIFGSNRRQTLENTPFTVQAAFCMCGTSKNGKDLN